MLKSLVTWCSTCLRMINFFIPFYESMQRFVKLYIHIKIKFINSQIRHQINSPYIWKLQSQKKHAHVYQSLSTSRSLYLKLGYETYVVTDHVPTTATILFLSQTMHHNFFTKNSIYLCLNIRSKQNSRIIIYVLQYKNSDVPQYIDNFNILN